MRAADRPVLWCFFRITQSHTSTSVVTQSLVIICLYTLSNIELNCVHLRHLTENSTTPFLYALIHYHDLSLNFKLVKSKQVFLAFL